MEPVHTTDCVIPEAPASYAFALPEVDTDGLARSHLFYQSRQRRPMLDRASGVHMWDVTGKRYLDGSSGAMVSNIGHSDPVVLNAMRAQMEKSTFGYRLHFENAPAENLARFVADLCPTGLDRVFFVSGGSEAVESALKLARQYALAVGQASRFKVISRYPSYHGATFGALAVTGTASMTAPFAPMMHEMPKIPAPTCYLDRDSLTMEERGRRYADMLEAEILRQGPETVLAFIMEPVGGASTGALVAPDSYYPRVREICDAYGVLLIYDEVMTGAGRTGRFLAAEHWGITPDLIALSKGFAAGYAPLGALVAPDRLVEPVMEHGGFIHGYTYAGNPLACAAGLAVLQETVGRDLPGNAARIGDQLKARLDGLKDRFPFIGDVRGKGLLLAVELVADRETMTPLPPEKMAAARLVDLAYERGLIIYWRRTRGGYLGDHIMVCPPLILTEDQIDEIMDPLTDALVALSAELGV
ncbi:aspartate aminotransferase family protein [Roseospira marina]|uniref:Aspartate aminotransferase family protein n=1 Tax=Roseospira marina TaxID=140057 RepID=A0A5M6IAX3_9PROT|nr:aspartate aminotransferase family protein [Roseospira marina]KAA5605373.1 aspartate aminotransferase family protein [Roseospira marina]MBB4314641.1 adenosylmethionine-8-amino-7-oxononanoate aminotransferase [Roseospira marina]MBB5088754.1 adenosylmethionine-8-amino-7-oxononanoate aminotransferase [Roseospira marina]